ncbi:MAG: hypothetical protein Q7U66_00570 [Methylobacter sp.]|nr:hypothetical protein [Methylobacter sp.]
MPKGRGNFVALPASDPIAKAIRDQLDLKAGQKFTPIAKGNIIELIPVRSLIAARGSFKGSNPNDYRDHQDRI